MSKPAPLIPLPTFKVPTLLLRALAEFAYKSDDRNHLRHFIVLPHGKGARIAACDGKTKLIVPQPERLGVVLPKKIEHPVLVAIHPLAPFLGIELSVDVGGGRDSWTTPRSKLWWPGEDDNEQIEPQHGGDGLVTFEPHPDSPAMFRASWEISRQHAMSRRVAVDVGVSHEQFPPIDQVIPELGFPPKSEVTDTAFSGAFVDPRYLDRLRTVWRAFNSYTAAAPRLVACSSIGPMRFDFDTVASVIIMPRRT